MRVVVRSVVLAVAMIVAHGTIARADDREDARKEFAAGQAADRRRDWRAAIEHYLRANDLVPHPFAIYNIAANYERLGQYREAATWYERYLDASSDLRDRDKVNRLLLALRARAGQVVVRTQPPGARVIIDGLPAGTTPLTTSLKGGRHRVVVEKDGQRDARDVSTEFGEPAEVDFTLRVVTKGRPGAREPVVRDAPGLRGPSGVLYVDGAPAGATVRVDGVPAGAVPVKINVVPGTHAVQVTANGHVPFQRSVAVTANQETRVEANLTRPLTGTGGRAPIRAGYLIGGGAGADVKGNGAMLLVEIGVRVNQYDLSARAGKLTDVTAVDLLARYTLTKSRLAPFVGFGYSYISDGFGYALLGGLRWDISRGDKLGLSLLAESGFRYYSAAPDVAAGSTAESGTIVPLMASLLVVYR